MSVFTGEEGLINEALSDLDAELLSEISGVNLSYLLLAHRLVRTNASEAIFRLGLSREMAELIAGLTLPQMMALSSTSQVLCRFRFNDHAILSALVDSGRDPALRQAHMTILMAAQPAEGFN